MRTTAKLAALLLALTIPLPLATAQQAQSVGNEEAWLPSLITATPQEGFELAVRLARRGVVATQPNRDVLAVGRQEYSHNPDSLIAVSHVVATHFSTIAAANGYWRSEDRNR
jgi:hypothetical protein